jgi:TPR repeat protein
MEEAAEYFKLSGDQGNSYGQNSYDLGLESGKGISLDPSEASRCYKQSADQGHSYGQFNYGHCLEEGRGAPMDLCETVQTVG